MKQKTQSAANRNELGSCRDEVRLPQRWVEEVKFVTDSGSPFRCRDIGSLPGHRDRFSNVMLTVGHRVWQGIAADAAACSLPLNAVECG